MSQTKNKHLNPSESHSAVPLWATSLPWGLCGNCIFIQLGTVVSAPNASWCLCSLG